MAKKKTTTLQEEIENFGKKNPTAVMTPVEQSETIGSLAGSNAPAPTVQPVKSYTQMLDEAAGFVPAAPKTERMEVGQEPNKSDYNFFSSLVNGFTEKPLSPEEQSRRERGAYAMKGIADLASGIGAFGNMFYASGGAAPVKPAETPDVDSKVMALRERADRVRDKYLQYQMSARKADQDEYASAYDKWFKTKKFNADAEQQDFQNGISRLNTQGQIAKGTADREDSAWTRQQKEKEFEFAKQKHNDDKALSWANHKLAVRRQNFAESNAEENRQVKLAVERLKADAKNIFGTGPTPMYVPDGNGELAQVKIDWSQAADNIPTLFANIPPEYSQKHRMEFYNAKNEKDRAVAMKNAVLDALGHDREYSENAYRLLQTGNLIGGVNEAPSSARKPGAYSYGYTSEWQQQKGGTYGVWGGGSQSGGGASW